MNIRQNKAITLIALIITIIVLLILAGVTISLLIGNNGIINHAKNSSIEYTKSQIKEEMQLAILDLQTDLLNKKPSENLTKQAIIDNLADKLDNTFTITNTLDGEYKGYNYYIDDEYVVHIGDKANGIITLNAKIKKIGTTYFTMTVEAKSTMGNIIGYTYIVDGVEKPQTTDTTYTEQNLEEKSNHTIKVIITDEKQNKKESRLFKITTEERLYLYKDGIDNTEITGGWEALAKMTDDNIGSPSASPNLTMQPDCISVNIGAPGSLYWGGIVATKNRMNLSEYKDINITYTASLGIYSGAESVDFILNNEETYAKRVGGHLCYGHVINNENTKIDISNYNGLYSPGVYVQAMVKYGPVNMKIQKIWLEK